MGGDGGAVTVNAGASSTTVAAPLARSVLSGAPLPVTLTNVVSSSAAPGGGGGVVFLRLYQSSQLPVGLTPAALNTSASVGSSALYGPLIASTPVAVGCGGNSSGSSSSSSSSVTACPSVATVAQVQGMPFVLLDGYMQTAATPIAATCVVLLTNATAALTVQLSGNVAASVAGVISFPSFALVGGVGAVYGVFVSCNWAGQVLARATFSVVSGGDTSSVVAAQLGSATMCLSLLDDTGSCYATNGCNAGKQLLLVARQRWDCVRSAKKWAGKRSGGREKRESTVGEEIALTSESGGEQTRWDVA